MKLPHSRTRTFDSNTLQRLPLHLYSLSVEKTRYAIGDAIVVNFSAPLAHLKAKDWVGLYRVGENTSSLITNGQSQGKWCYVSGSKDIMDEAFIEDGSFGDALVETIDLEKLVKGKLIFQGYMLPFRPGKYEFRYHYDGRYNVLGSPVFIEIIKPTFDANMNFEDQLLDVVEKCLVLTGLGDIAAAQPLSVDGDILEALKYRLGSVEKGLATLMQPSLMPYETEFA